MDRPRDESGKQRRTEVLDCLTDGRRRRIVRWLAGRATPATERELAEELLRSEQGSSGDVTDAERRRIRTRLHHVDLPKLDRAGFVAWNETDGTVAPTDHPILDDPRYERILEGDDDRRIEAIANERRRVVLTVLASRPEPLSRTELARTVAARHTDGEPSSDAVAAEEALLHHAHLPKLERAALVEYDPDEETVAYRGPSELPRVTTPAEPVFGPAP